MDQSAGCKPSGSVGLVALDLLRRVFGVGPSRRSRYNYGKLSGFDERGIESDRDDDYDSWTPIENDDEEVELRALTRSSHVLRQRQRSSFSSNDSSRRWTSADQYFHRRRKGFYCMRLRIVNMARLVAMMKKVRVAYRRMMNAAAESKTILSLADLYNDIADLIPVPSRSSKVRTIVVIRPIKCASVSAADGAEELPAVLAGHGSNSRSSTTTSTTCGYARKRRQAGSHDIKSTCWGPATTDHKNSSCRKFAFPSFSRAFSLSSCTWPSTTTDFP